MKATKQKPKYGARMIELHQKALDTVAELLECENLSVRLQAARTLLKLRRYDIEAPRFALDDDLE